MCNGKNWELPRKFTSHRYLLHLLALLGCCGEQELHVRSGRDQPRAHGDEFRRQLRARRQTADTDMLAVPR
jgi:hypothetical protein